MNFTSSYTKKKRGFTIVELVVATTIIGMIAVLVSINLVASQRNTRDTRRIADASALLTSVTQYVQANGTSFITYPDSNKNPQACTFTSATDPSEAAGGLGCVGASGRSYGLVNMASNTITGAGGGSNTTRVYAAHSIVQALQAGGYLNVTPQDPSNKVGTLTNSNDAANTIRDYDLIRACPDGEQHVASRGQLYAVWVMLENKPSVTQTANLARVVGSLTAAPLDANGNPGGYDFASGSYQTTFQNNGYGVSNGPSQPQDVSQAGKCTTGPVAG